jgi:putative tryptophan/tyrosine transport system substrate-binding protein
MMGAAMIPVPLLLLVLIAVPLAAEAHLTGKIPRIGVLVSGPPPGEHVCVLALRQGFLDLGYVEGRTHVLELRWAEGRPEKTFPKFGEELVRLGVDLIVSVTAEGLVEAKQAIANVPVVMAVSTHAVERRVVAGFNRPGGNITGLATFTGEMFAKRVQLLAEALPGVSRIGVLRLPGDLSDFVVRDLEMAARRLGLKLQVAEVQGPQDFPAAFQALVQGGVKAIMTAQGPFFLQHVRQTAELAMKHKLPSFSGEPTAVDAGMLMTAGASVSASCHRAAYFVDRILKGAKPADLPLEQSPKFNLEINLKTAKALGLTIPQSLLLQADRIIE